MNPIVTDPARRHDFVLLFDVQDGNPNGDPDAGNLPRVDPETMHGLVTDVALKRKVRDYIDVARGEDDARCKIYVQHDKYLTDTRARIFKNRGGDAKTAPATARAWMCEEFFDVRLFGAVMSMKEANAGQVRGPIQMTFARSIDPIVPLDMSIVGPAQNKAQSAKSDKDTTDDTDRFGTMGRKSTVPYGLYRGHGFFNPHFAAQTGVTSDDLELFWTALQNMWDLDRSASRGMLTCRGIYVFSHENRLGNAPAHRLFELVQTPPSAEAAPRTFSHYTISAPPEGALAHFPGVNLTALGV